MNPSDLQAILSVYRSVLCDVLPADATIGQIAVALMDQSPAVLSRLDRALASAGADQILAAQEPPDPDTSLAWAIDDEGLVYTPERGAEGRAYLTQMMAKASTQDSTQSGELAQLKGLLAARRLSNIFEEIGAPKLDNQTRRAGIADAKKVHSSNDVTPNEGPALTSSQVLRPHKSTMPAQEVAAKTSSTAKKKTLRLASGRKRTRQDIKLNAANTSLRSKFRTVVKNVQKAVAAGDKAKTSELFKAAQSVIDSVADQGAFHKSKAIRHKSRLATKTSLQKKAG